MHKYFLYLALTAAIAFGQQAQSPTYNPLPSREIGQPALLPSLNSIAPNLVEGRELNSPFAMAFDNSVSPPILYIADTYNHRVLAWKNPANLGPCGINSFTSGCGAANLVIGQRDMTTTLPGGPGAQSPSLSTGFAYPTSVAVDNKGNLYVADAGNNRVLRFPAPFQQTSAQLTPDLVIGQKTVNSGNSGNQGMQLPTAQTVYFFNGTLYRASLAIDPVTQDLWVTDPINNRALHFPASTLAPNTIQPAADFALGQLSLTSNTVPQTPSGTQSYLYRNSLSQPAGIVFDQNEGLYIADNYGRVLYYTPPFVSFQGAARILGIAENLGSTALPPINMYGLAPAGLFTNGTNLFVADAGYNRIVEYDIPSKWPAGPNPSQSPQTVEDSPPMLAVFGQTGFTTGKANKGQPEADATTVNAPLGGAFSGTDMWIADFGNNRALKFPLQGGTYSSATGLVGQVDFPYSQPNLIEGREVFLTIGNGIAGGDAAVDTSSSATAPHLYVADTLNHRILGFMDARKVQPGQVADIVIGQSDTTMANSAPGSRFYRALINSPQNDPEIPSNTGLNQPTGVLVDTDGSLWVADTGNGRVLRFPTPFSQTAGAQQMPNLVLGQQSFNSQIFDPSVQTMHSPYGLALFSNRSLAVSDPFHNRILVFERPSGSDFSNGQNAAVVLGQPNPGSITASSADAGLNSPRHIATDTSDRLYVADSNNNRMLVFDNPSSSPSGTAGTASVYQLNNVQTPQGVAVNSLTGEIWLTAGSSLWLLPELDKLQLNGNPNNAPTEQVISLQTVPSSIALDASFNPIVAEEANRVSFYFPEMTWRHAGNYNQQPLAPGQLAILGRVGEPFVLADAAATILPWPTNLGDLQLTVNGILAPIFNVSSAQSVISFQVPAETPPSGTANFVLTRYSTGEILAAATIPMQQFNPGFFTVNEQGTGLIAALNYNPDGSFGGVNSASNPIARDGQHIVQFYLTGGGVFSGGPAAAPADGNVPSGAAATSLLPTMLNGSFGANGTAPSKDLLYSGAGPYPGVWVINWLIDSMIPPSSATGGVTIVALTMNGVASSVGPSGTIQAWIYTK